MLTATPDICGGGFGSRERESQFIASPSCTNKGKSPEEIVETYSHLTLGQVYAALAYYHANRAEIESDLAADDALYDELREQGYA